MNLSNVTLKELQDIHCNALEKSYFNGYKKSVQLQRYADFLEAIKIIDETYFGTKITLKNELPQAVVESIQTGVGKYFGQDVEPFQL